MVEILYIKNERKLSDKELAGLEVKISANEFIKAGRYKKWEDRQSCILGKCLLGFLLEQNGYSREVMAKMEYNEYGKPFIMDISFHFNISHSGQYVICAFSALSEIGIDIEEIKEMDLEDFSYVLTVGEKERLHYSSDKVQQFFDIWSSKEAVLKANGGGLSLISHIQLDANKRKAFLKEKTYYVQEIKIDSSYSCFCASEFDISSSLKIKEILLLTFL